jgi:hypothetical protein
MLTPTARQMPLEREPFLEESLDQRPVLGRDAALVKLPDKLAAAGFAPVVLLTVVDVTVLLVVPRPAPRASASYDHDQRIDFWGSRVVGNLSPNHRRALHGAHHRLTCLPREICAHLQQNPKKGCKVRSRG